jgi:probable F420-dependent oxidoreductase
MKFAVNMPNSIRVLAISQPWEATLSGVEIAGAMTLADDLGYDKITCGEHFIIPTEHLELSGAHYMHAVAALSFLAGHTKRARLASTITLLPLQSPIVQAKAWATLDWLSGGRAAPIFGVGWLKEEFDLMGVDFHKRGKISDEYIAAMIELWNSDDPRFSGEFTAFENALAEPRPVQKPHLPVWFGGDAEPVLRRVAKFGDGWSPFRTPPEDFPKCLDFIRAQPEYDGRPIDMFFTLEMLNIGAHHEVMNDDRAAGEWDVQKIVDQIGWLAGLGVTETSVSLPKLRDFDEYLDRLRWAAEEIFPKCRSM